MAEPHINPAVKAELERAQRERERITKEAEAARARMDADIQKVKEKEAAALARLAQAEAAALEKERRIIEEQRLRESDAAYLKGQIEAAQAEAQGMAQQYEKMLQARAEVQRRQQLPEYGELMEQLGVNRRLASLIAGLQPGALESYLPQGEESPAPMFPAEALASLLPSVRRDIVSKHLERQLAGMSLARLGTPDMLAASKEDYLLAALKAIESMAGAERGNLSKAQFDALHALKVAAAHLGIVPAIDTMP